MSTTVYAGQRITAALLQQAIPLTAVRTSDATAIQSSTALANDDTLFLPVAANAVYIVQGYIVYASGSGQGFQAGWGGPSGATLTWSVFPRLITAGTGYAAPGEVLAIGGTSNMGGNGVGVGVPMTLQGLLQTGGTAGTLHFKWAQWTSGAFNTQTLTGSWLMAQQVS